MPTLTKKKDARSLKYIERFKNVHDNKYIYDKFVYTKIHDKSIITCPIHGDFEQEVASHLNGHGCSECVGQVKPTTKLFVERAELKHGKGTYDYSKSIYTRGQDKIIIICPIEGHGEFEQRAADHLKGHGCRKCAGMYKPSKDEFITRSKSLHGENTFGYELVEYKTNTTPIKLVCKIDDHGVFEITPSSHIHQLAGCPRCSGKWSLTEEVFRKESIKKFGEKYDLKNFVWLDVDSSGVINCKVHGEFYCKPKLHLSAKFGGCKKCANMYQPSTEEFIAKSKKLYPSLCTYENTVYNRSNIKLKINCVAHGEFEVTPYAHLNQTMGCKMCYGTVTSHDKFVMKIKEIFNDNITVIGHYNGTKIPIKMNCIEHGIFEKNPINLLQGVGCNKCSNTDFPSLEKLIRKGKEIFGDFYDYSQSIFVDINTPTKILCPIHGCFEKSYKNHILQKLGCTKCSRDSVPNMIREKYFTYSEAKIFCKTNNITSAKEYFSYYIKNKKTCKLSPIPHIIYDEWTNWQEFLETIGNGKSVWTKSAFLSYLKNTEYELTALDSIELITIINSNNLARKINQLGCLQELISSEAHSSARKKILKEITDKIEEVNDMEIESDDDTVLQTKIIESEKDETVPTELIPFNPIDELKATDCKNLTISLDDENIEFLLKNKLNKLWYNVLNQKVDVEKLKWEIGGNNFELIKQWFFEEYNAINEIQLPVDYNFRNQHGIIKPNFMQLLTAHRLLKEKSYGNWSDTGAGKTLSAILAGRIAGAKNTLIICNNATVEGWVKSIDEYFINNNIFVKHQLSDEIPKNIYKKFNKYTVCLPGNTNNYLVINYETFQQDDGEYIVHELLKNNVFNYIILDEVQNVKQREADKESNRRNVISKLLTQARTNNPDILTMAMTATPVINNLFEARMLIELLTGVEHKELNTSESIINGVEMYKALTRHGLRYIPNYGITVNEETITVDGYELKEQILNVANGDVVGFEKVLLPAKLEAMKDKIRKGTMIYTHYVTELIPTIQKFVEDLGYTVGLYTGVDKLGLSKFKKGQVDVLIGSAPVGTGVDGIQKVCNTLIPVCLPWTNSEWRQIKGRIDRQGSHFNHINIYIPEVVITTDNGEWSWDRRRFNIIRFKATLADLAVDGRVPNRLLPSKAKMVEDAKKELREWIQRLESGDFITFERSELKIPLNPELVKKEQRVHGDFSKMNQRWSVSNSKTTFERLQKSQDEWYYYHTLYSEKRKTWSEIPYIEISKKIQTRPEWLVGDFGCGENLLAKELKNKVLAFDYVALNDTVTACDISNVPLDDNTLDVAVFSLSLMGDNYQDYLTEAYRVLKPHGTIFVAEPAEKWLGREHELKAALENVGFKCFNAVKNTGKFIYFDGMKY